MYGLLSSFCFNDCLYSISMIGTFALKRVKCTEKQAELLQSWSHYFESGILAALAKYLDQDFVLPRFHFTLPSLTWMCQLWEWSIPILVFLQWSHCSFQDWGKCSKYGSIMKKSNIFIQHTKQQVENNQRLLKTRIDEFAKYSEVKWCTTLTSST